MNKNDQPTGATPQALRESNGSEDNIVLELKLPVSVKELAAVTKALCRIHGKKTLFMRQVGTMLQLYKPRLANPPNAPDQARHE